MLEMILLLLASGGGLLVAIVALFELKAARERRRMALKPLPRERPS
ncbi:hypothetical protein [Bradyrhizobium sp. AC87j1]|nr:hypothetical protein [Bradyrhizobium sp. AC87j1]